MSLRLTKGLLSEMQCDSPQSFQVIISILSGLMSWMDLPRSSMSPGVLKRYGGCTHHDVRSTKRSVVKLELTAGLRKLMLDHAVVAHQFLRFFDSADMPVPVEESVHE